MRLILLIVFNCFSFSIVAQKISGTVYTDKGDLLPYATITVKGTSIGTSASNKGNFSISMRPGTYELVCQHIGYQAAVKQVELIADTEITFILSEQKLLLKEVIVKSGGEDPAYEIIRQAIKKRPFYNKQVNGFICDMYGKDLVKLRKLPKSVLGKKIKEEDRQEMGVDSTGKGIIYLSESISKAYLQQPDKFKMEVISSRVSGSAGFGFTFPAFISLYNSNVTVFTQSFNKRGFVSPIADGAIGFYKFKFLGTFWEDGKAINSIKVTPRRNYEPLFSGIINITDEDWRIHSFDLLITKTSQLEILDTLKISQLHVPASGDVWRTKNQMLYFNFKLLGIDMVGNFLTVYSNYQIDPVIDKKFFDRVVIKYDTAVNKRTKEYWDSARAVPLEIEEIKDYIKKDSIYKRNKDSLLTSMHIDSLKKRQGKIDPTDLFLSGIHRTRYSKTNQFTWGIEPLIFNSEYNTVEGVAITLNSYISKQYRKSVFSFEPKLRYGFSNGHFNPSATIVVESRTRNEGMHITKHTWLFSGGKRVSDFNKESQIHPLSNTIRILFDGKNYTKIYENYFGSIGYRKNFENGIHLNMLTEYEDRIPLENSSFYTFRKNDTINITPNFPYRPGTDTIQFKPHQALLLSFEISFRPGERYIQLPYSKIPIGSKYPTYTLKYTKGIGNIFGSDTDFDKWRASVSQDKNLKLAGTFMYNIGMGGFINRKKVFIQDYQHFNRNMGRLNSFQLADFFAHSTTAGLYVFGHVEHHFNGLITNKIPLFKRLNWNLVAASNAFYVNKNENYIEISAGLENIFKILRVDFVAGYEPGKPVTTGVRIIGSGRASANAPGSGRRGNSVSINL